jgi:MFS family permease
VDRFGPLPVFRLTAFATAALLAAFAAFGGAAGAGAMVGFFFLLAVLNSGFGVADTHVLFGLAPDREPTPTLVVADVTTSLAYGAGPLLAGLLLGEALDAGREPELAYRVLFYAAAALTALAPLPLRGLRRERES